MYTFVGDNVDERVKTRYMRVGTNIHLDRHYFHSYALADRIDFSDLSDRHIPTGIKDPRQIALSLLPTVEDDLNLRNNVCTLMARVFYENMQFFSRSFDGVVNWHIGHEWHGEMSKKSIVVS